MEMQLEAGCQCCPCLEKPPEPQPTDQTALTSFQLRMREDQEPNQKTLFFCSFTPSEEHDIGSDW